MKFECVVVRKQDPTNYAVEFRAVLADPSKDPVFAGQNSIVLNVRPDVAKKYQVGTVYELTLSEGN